jgi:hypothetical protein
MTVLAFCAGPLLGWWLVPILVTPVVKVRRRSWLVPAAFSTGACALAAWVAYWVLWSAGFNDADSLRPVPGLVNTAGNVAWAVCSGGVAVLALLAGATVIAWWRARRGLSNTDRCGQPP